MQAFFRKQNHHFITALKNGVLVMENLLINNIESFFKYQEGLNHIVFYSFYQIREMLIERNDTVNLEKIDTIYNNNFLEVDLTNYIDRVKNPQNLIDKEIFEYLKLYGCRADLFTYFENKNKTITLSEIENKTKNNDNVIDFNLFKKNANAYANF